MKVVITGGAGFLGERLAKSILELGSLTRPDQQRQPIERIVLVDSIPAQVLPDSRVQMSVGDIADSTWLGEVIGSDTDAIFHLAAIVSGRAEADFELGMRVNLDATRRLLDICRTLAHPPVFVFASSVAVFGGNLPEVVDEAAAPNPQSSYGTQKAIGELLVNDYSRRGVIDGRSLRLPTVSVRPGLPNQAASVFASNLIREPLAGRAAVCPVASSTRLWLLSPRQAIASLIHAHELPAEMLGDDRSITLPGLTVSVAEMVSALERVAGTKVSGLIRWEPDPAIARIVSSWPGAFATPRANGLGFGADPDYESIIRAYIAEQAIVLPEGHG